jgi:hypothetical protein
MTDWTPEEDEAFNEVEKHSNLGKQILRHLNNLPKSSGMDCCTYDCIQGRDCPVRKANSLKTKMINFVDEFAGSEQIRHPMFSEGYDYALWQINQIIKDTENDPNLRNDEAS